MMYLIIGASILVVWVVKEIITYWTGLRGTLSTIKRKQDEREAQFQKLKSTYGTLTPKYLSILALNDDELIEKLQKRELKSLEVLEAFIAKTLQSNESINAVTEFNVPSAFERAKALDASPKVVGPLHGLPISVKDNCHLEGMDSSLGLGKFLYKPMDESAPIVKAMVDLGAVPFVKTNVPQTLLSFGCSNPVFGLTKNPLNLQLSPGGSSGGESSLIASGGSRLGIGSDIGGSVRIPAHFTGICGLKVTKNRLSSAGFRGSLPNVVGVLGVPGLLSTSVSLLVRASKALLSSNIERKYDPLTLPIPWNDKIASSSSPLRIGYFTSLPYFPPIGDTKDVVMEAKKKLEAKGHVLVPFEFPVDSFDMMDLVFDFCFADSGKYLLDNWRHEPIPLALIVNFLICRCPLVLRKLIVMIMSHIPFITSKRAISIIGAGARDTVTLWKRLGDRKVEVEKLLRAWKDANLDLVLCPTYPFPAVPNGATGRLQPSVCYTMMWNLFDFPAGVVPFGKESGNKIDDYNTEGDFVLKTGKKAAKSAVGMPISVQLVGLPYSEEIVLKGMEELI